MSIHSVEDFEPTSSAPVFGSAVSQTKIQQQQQPNNDLGGAEKLVTPPQPVVNGQNDTTNNKNSDNLGNGTTEAVNGNTGTNGSTDVHVNGQNGKTAVDTLPPINATTKDDVNPTEETISSSGAPEPIEKSSQNDSLPAPSNEPTGSVSPTATPSIDAPVPTEPKPALSPSADVAKEDLSSVPSTNIDNVAPPPPVETTSTPTPTPTLNDNVPASAPAPEATVSAESFVTPERKSKSPRVKAKSPVVSTPPTRQSTRSRKPVLSSSPNEDETDDIGATTTSQPESSPSPKRTKRQAATKATDAIQASNEPTSTSGSTVTEEVNDPTDHDAIPSDVEEDDDDIKESKTKKKSPSPRKGARASTSSGRKRVASSSPTVSASKKKKASPKGKQSTTLNDEQPIEVENPEATTTESETVQTPPKKERTSGNRKTPTSTTPTPEYVRKLRPRK